MDNGCFYRYAHKKELGDCEGPVDDDTALCRGHFKNLSIIDQVGMSFEDLSNAINESLEIEAFFVYLVALWWGWDFNQLLIYFQFASPMGVRWSATRSPR